MKSQKTLVSSGDQKRYERLFRIENMKRFHPTQKVFLKVFDQQWLACKSSPGFSRVTNRHALTPPNGSLSVAAAIKISGKVGRVGSFFLRAPLLGGKSGGVVRRAPPPPAWWSCKKLIPGKNLMAGRTGRLGGWRGSWGRSSRLLADTLACC